MPKKGLRTSRSGDLELRRLSTLDPFNLVPPTHYETPLRGTVSAEFHSTERPSTPGGGPYSGDVDRMSTLESPTSAARPRPSQDSTWTSRGFFYKWRHASDSQLAAKARNQKDQDVPPVPALPRDPPAIVMTAPTTDETTHQERRKTKFPVFARPKSPLPFVSEPKEKRKHVEKKEKRPAGDRRRTMLFGNMRHVKDSSEFPDRGAQSLDLNGLAERAEHTEPSLAPPSTNGQDSTQSTDQTDHDQTNQRPKSAHSKSWLPRRNKNRQSLFPLPVKLPPPQFPNTAPATPRASTSALSTNSPNRSPNRYSPNRSPNRSPGEYSPPLTSIRRTSTSDGVNGFHPPPLHAPHHTPQTTLAASSVQFAAAGGGLLRNDSNRSDRSSPALAPPPPFRIRNRSSTLGSTGARSEDGPMAPPTPPNVGGGGGSGRNSTSTGGRSSFSNLLTIGRLRHGSEPYSPRQGSPALGINGGTSGIASNTNSFTISREALKITLPERLEGETAGKYLVRVEDSVDKSQIPSVLSKQTDEFFITVMRSFMRKFAFFGDPLDMAIRKLLMEVDLPKETQQIDRMLQSFSDRYHECNPGIFISSEKAYFIAFSILILQTDAFNKNNKRKMSKADYLKNSTIDGVCDDALSCFYDNIVYTPFIRVEDDIDLRASVRKFKKTLTKPGAVEQLKKVSATKEPIDPYALILDGRLDLLRPPLKDVMNLEDPYTYLGTASRLDAKDMSKPSKCGTLQIESLRSRPDAFLSPATTDNPEDGKSGLVDLPVDKVGLLWRKDPKKKAARSPWQEWGAILTGSGLSFFRNAGWVKNLMHQYDTHMKHAHHGAFVIFRPPIQMFKPDYFLPTDRGVALYDTSYRKHKNGFVFFTHSGTEEVFLADNEPELNDWLAKINHQASYKTASIRPRGLVGGNYEGQRQRALRRLQSSNSTRTIQTPTGEVTIQSGNIDFLLAQQISEARRENMQKKIEEFEERLSSVIKQLDGQLRDARHLLVLAPIQQKSREQLVHAAGRMAAQLKWVRIEMWRLKCHRDILTVDLDEENKLAGSAPARSPHLQPRSPSPVPSLSHSAERLARITGLLRLGSSTDADAEHLQLQQPGSPTTSVRPETKDTGPSVSSSNEPSEDEVYKTPPENTPQPSPAFPSAAWGSPTPRIGGIREGSGASNQSRSPRIDDGTWTGSSVSSAIEQPLPDSPIMSQLNSPMSETAPAEPSPRPLPAIFDGRPGTASDSEAEPFAREPVGSPEPMAGSPESKTKSRRSLKGTLRDVRDSPIAKSPMGHHRSRKGKDSNGSILSEKGDLEAEPDSLKRTKGSFTVHGKKASVVTFGSEWQDMSAEDKLKLRKQAQATATEIAITAPEEDEADMVTPKKSDRAASFSSSRSAPLSDPRRESDVTANSDGNARHATPTTVRERMALRKQSYQTSRGISRSPSMEPPALKEAAKEPESKEEENEQATAQSEEADGNDLNQVESAKAQAVEA